MLKSSKLWSHHPPCWFELCLHKHTRTHKHRCLKGNTPCRCLVYLSTSAFQTHVCHLIFFTHSAAMAVIEYQDCFWFLFEHWSVMVVIIMLYTKVMLQTCICLTSPLPNICLSLLVLTICLYCTKHVFLLYQTCFHCMKYHFLPNQKSVSAVSDICLYCIKHLSQLNYHSFFCYTRHISYLYFWIVLNKIFRW